MFDLLKQSLGYSRFRPLYNGLAALLFLLLMMPGGRASESQTVVMLGDSLTAGYGLAAEHALPAQLEAALKEMEIDVVVQNAGVSGDTTAGGLARLDWALADKPKFVIVALGGNDGLRGVDPAETRANLTKIIVELKQRGISVLLAGMLAPPNLGRAYGEEFNAIFPALAESSDIAFYPFLLQDVAAVPDLNQPDGIHPNQRGVAVIVENIAPLVASWLKPDGRSAD